MITEAPASAIITAVACPIPPPAPVTTITLPSNMPATWCSPARLLFPIRWHSLKQKQTRTRWHPMQGLNQDYPLTLSTVLEHAAANFADVPVVSHNRGEVTRYDYSRMGARARRLGSVL